MTPHRPVPEPESVPQLPLRGIVDFGSFTTVCGIYAKKTGFGDNGGDLSSESGA